MRKVTDLKGFTLIEILIVIGLIAILAAVTIIALNPTASFAKARDSERQTEMAQIFTAINRYVVDGNSADGITGIAACLGTAPEWTGNPDFPAAFATTLTTGGYLQAMPTDPTAGAQYKVCYVSGTAGPMRLIAPAKETSTARISMVR